MDKKLLILDLDETLIYATQRPLAHREDFLAGHYFVYERPYLSEFLNFCREHFQVAVWTSSNELYANAIVKNLFGEDYPLAFVWSRNRCVQKFDFEFYEHFYIKDLKKVKRKGFDLEQVIMVDNTPKKLMRNYGNLLKVTSFEGNRRDEELLDLMPYLQELKSSSNIRKVEKRFWKLRTV